MSTSQLALLGGTPVGAPERPQHPNFDEAAIQRVVNMLREGRTVGLNRNYREIAEAEDAIAEWQGVKHCLLASSGHAALHDSLIGLEITWGDEVITTPFTWGASISCILHNNAIPVFVDVCPDTGLLDPDAVEAAITRNTKAILAVHIFGQAANMTALRQIADRHDLCLIEDGSQAHGALHAGRKVGTFGDAAGFSCMGGKLLATAEAGYMVTENKDVYWRAALCGQHKGRSLEEDFPSERYGHYVDSLIYTYRLSPVTAVMLTEQLRKLDAELAGRRENVRLFRKAMKGIDILSFPEYAAGDEPSYHMLTMNWDETRAGIQKETFFQALAAEGVSCSQYVPSPICTWPRLHWQTYNGPRVMWTEPLRRHGIDYSAVNVPNCEHKIRASVEMGWNFTEPDESGMQRLADAFAKVHDNLDALQEYERSNNKAEA